MSPVMGLEAAETGRYFAFPVVLLCEFADNLLLENLAIITFYETTFHFVNSSCDNWTSLQV